MHTASVSLPASTGIAAGSRTSVWVGRILSAIAVLLLAMDTAIKLLMLPVAVQATTALGFSPGNAFAIGIIEAACLVLYVTPRTALLGAVLWIGYFGGAVATHLQLGSALLSHTLSPVYMATLLWVGLCLRDAHARDIVRASFAGAR